jgi:hypothetical protein
MIKKNDKFIEIPFVTKNSEYTINAELEIHTDTNDGADADGNRGRTVHYVEDVLLLGLYTMDGVDILDRIPKSVKTKVYDYAVNYANQ